MMMRLRKTEREGREGGEGCLFERGLCFCHYF